MNADSDDPLISHEPEPGPPDPASAAWQSARVAGLAAAKAGDAASAERHWRQALELSEQFPDPDPRLAQSCEDLGGLYAQLRRHSDAVVLFRKVLEVRELFVFPADLPVGETLYHLGWSLWQSGRGREAEPIIRRAIPLAEAGHGPRSLRVAHLLNNLALVLAECGENDDDSEQEQLLKEALSIKEEVCGPSDAEVAGAEQPGAAARATGRSRRSYRPDAPQPVDPSGDAASGPS